MQEIGRKIIIEEGVFMKRGINCLSLFVVLCIALSACGTEHKHTFDQKIDSADFIKQEATCTAPMEYYYSCSCGAKGTESFTVGLSLEHDYTAEIVAEEYLKEMGDCQHPSTYYKSCTLCGKKGYSFH